MATAKTQVTAETFDQFLARAVDPARHADCRTIAALMQAASGEAPVMWGAIIGFGRYKLRYSDGREAEWPIVAFAARKTDLTIYVVPGVSGYEALLSKLGKHKTSKACLYIKRLSDIDVNVLRTMIEASVKAMASRRVVT